MPPWPDHLNAPVRASRTTSISGALRRVGGAAGGGGPPRQGSHDLAASTAATVAAARAAPLTAGLRRQLPRGGVGGASPAADGAPGPASGVACGAMGRNDQPLWLGTPPTRWPGATPWPAPAPAARPAPTPRQHHSLRSQTPALEFTLLGFVNVFGLNARAGMVNRVVHRRREAVKVHRDPVELPSKHNGSWCPSSTTCKPHKLGASHVIFAAT